MDVFAQTGGSAPPANSTIGMLLTLLQFLPIFLILYFLIIRPQQQRQKQTERMLKALKKGDRVLTTGGIYGTVVGLDDAKAVLKIADDTKVEFAKTAIVQVMSVEASG
jgi:preprotein translocase subunit YajC